MRVGVLRESYPGERRVALVPLALGALKKAGHEIYIEASAGMAAGYRDSAYEQAGATIRTSRSELIASSDVLLKVRAFGADSAGGSDDFGEGKTVIGLMDPLGSPESAVAAAERGMTAFALELVPRITRAQSMDVLSSQASLAGYKAVILAAASLPKIFPMMMTAAGTITPARVFVIGAGVAGLQAIATARRLGAIVSGYDVRPAVKEQVESLGARFVALPLSEEDSEGGGGYAKAMGEEFYKKQAELMSETVASNDVVIATAAIPGETAPVLVRRDMVEKMAPGSVIVDLAAERGGNCELTRLDETVIHNGVTILGPANLPSTLANHASQVFAKNIASFLLHVAKESKIPADPEDEITRESLVTYGGQVVHARVRQKLDLAPLELKQEQTAPEPALAEKG